jgi:hypothetical protein
MADPSIDPRIVERAKQIWNAREPMFPKFTQQTWEQGTWAARSVAIAMAMRELENEPLDPSQ